MRLLIIEDDAGVASALGEALSRAGHSWRRGGRGADALAHHHEHDMVLLDLGLPDIDGFELLPRLRAVTDIPVIALTGRAAERDTVRALQLGADDYLVKPLRLQELLARIDLVMRRRRSEPGTEARVVQVADVAVDLAARTVTRAGRSVDVTRTEFAILTVLCERVGEAVSREKILRVVWGDTFVSTSRSLSVHLARLRFKLGRPDLITTVRGHGYRFES